jgi:hypothetical protein
MGMMRTGKQATRISWERLLLSHSHKEQASGIRLQLAGYFSERGS